MKSTAKIIALSVAVAGIIMFWLAPGINKAGNERYTRIYEDTDKPQSAVTDNSRLYSFKDTTKTADREKKAERRKYKRESIKAGAKFSDIKPSMFSRAIQFEKEIEIPIVEKSMDDSVSLSRRPSKIAIDSTKHTQAVATSIQ